MTPKQAKSLETLITLAIKYRLKSLSCGDMKVELSDKSQPEATESVTPQYEQAAVMPSDEDLLFWSSGGDLPSEELQAKLERDRESVR